MEMNLWDADWQPYEEDEDDPFSADWQEMAPETMQAEPMQAGAIPEPDTEAMDYPKLLAKGTGTAVKGFGVLGAIKSDPMALGGMAAEAIGEFTDSKTLRAVGGLLKGASPHLQTIEAGRQAEEYWEEKLSPGMKAEREKPFVAKDEEGYHVGPGLKSPTKIASTIVESIPSSLVGMGGGGMIAKGLMTAGIGISKGMAGVIGGAIGEGLMSGTVNAEEIYQQIMRSPTKQLRKMPAYQEVLNALPENIPKQNKERLTKKILALSGASFVGATTTLTTGLLGAPSGHAMGKLVGGDLGKSVWRNILWQAVSEGLIEEAPQSGIEQYVNNLTTKALVNAEQELGEGVLESMVGGAVAGSAMGGGMAVGFREAGKKVQGDESQDIMATEKKPGDLEARLLDDFNNGRINSGQLNDLKVQLPEKHPVRKTIDILLKKAVSTTTEKDIMTGQDLRLVPEEAGPPLTAIEDIGEAIPIEIPETAIPMPGAYPPLAGTSARESAQVFEQDRLKREQEQRRIEQEQAERERLADQEAAAAAEHRKSLATKEGLKEQLRAKEEKSAIEGMEYKVPYIRGLLEQVKGAEAGKRIRVKDYDGTEKWFGVPSEFPDFMRNRYSKKEVVQAIEKGLSGYVFPESEVKQASIWEDVKSEAYQMRNRDLRLAAETYIEEPAAIEGLDDSAYKLLITELQHEGYSTRQIEEIAARHRKKIEGDVIASIANEYGFSEEEIRTILEDPLEPISDLEHAWKEATFTKPVSAYLTPITEAEGYESEKERRLARPEPQREETPGRAILEREAGRQEAAPSGVFQGPSAEEAKQKGELIAKLINGNLFPGHKLKFDGIWPGEPALNIPDMYQFTPYAGTASGATFLSKDLEADEVVNGLKIKIDAFKKKPPIKDFQKAIDQAAQEAETAPTPAQIEAGNYKKGHINIQGLDITIENPKGSTRSGVDRSGKKWSTKMQHHYGYIRRTQDKDGDQVDVFIGDPLESDQVFIVNQVDPETKAFDEHKVMIGFPDEKAARLGYQVNYQMGWQGLGNIVSMSMESFKAWLKFADQSKPASKTQAVSGHGLTFMKHHKNKADLEGIYNRQVKYISERPDIPEEAKADLLARVKEAHNIELKKYPAVSRETLPQEPIEEILEHPGATQAEVIKEKVKLKNQVIEGVKSGEFTGAVRFATVIDLKKTLKAGKLYVSRYGAIHATPILGKDDDVFQAYGSYKNHAVAYIIPDKYVQELPGATTKEVSINPEAPLDEITFLIDGHEKAYTSEDLAEAIGVEAPAPKEEKPVVPEPKLVEKEPLELTPEKGTPWERQAELEREGVVKRPAKGKKVKAAFGVKPITGVGVAGRQQGLFGYAEGETTDIFAEAEKEAVATVETAEDIEKEPVEIPPAKILENAGLVVTETLTKPKKAGKKPRPVWEVSGRLDPFVEIIRDLGGRKWGGKYSFWGDPTEDLAEAKADRLEERAGKAQGRASAARKREESISGMIPMGQPILVGHHSEGRHRRDLKRIHSLVDKQITEREKAEWLEERATFQRQVAKGEYSLRFMQNRVDDAETDVRRLERILSGKQYGAGVLKNEQYRERIVKSLADAQEKIKYWKAGIEDAGGINYSKENVKKGDRVKIRGAWCIVLRANPKTVGIIIAEGGAQGMKLNYKYAEIQEAELQQPEVKEAIPEKATAVKAPGKKEKGRIASLRRAADTLQKTIDQKRNPAVANQNITRRRAGQIASAAADADRLEQIQMVMRGLADDAEKGTLPVILEGINSKVQIEQLLTRKNFTLPHFHKTYLKDLVSAIKGVKGLSGERMALGDMSRRARHSEYSIDIHTPLELKAVEAAIKRSGVPGMKYVKDDLLQGKRLQALNIKNQDQYDAVRDLLEQYINPPDPLTQKQKQIREKETDLIGIKMPGFFPTPQPVGSMMVEAAEIEPGDLILEPEAGKGDLVEVIKDAHPDNSIQVAEINQSLRELLTLKGFDIIGDDFLDMKLSAPGVQGLDVAYDKIIMNPPYELMQDIEHVRHAYDLLAPGGRIVALMSEGPFFREEKKSIAFREWLDDLGGTSEKLPDKSFTGKEAFRQTGVSARMVIIDKPGKKPQGETLLSIENKKPWPEDFPKIIAHTTAAKVINHADHKAAKAGDKNAAERLVDSLIKHDRIKGLAKRHAGAVVVAVHAQEESGLNKIPQAYAEALGAIGDFDVDNDIVQTNVSAHTGKSALTRILSRATFSGKVEPGRDYIIVDDIVTQGGTVSELRHYIENNGGRVVEISSLAFSQFSNVVPVNPDTVKKLEKKFGRNELESILQENSIAGTLEALTQSEARQILLYASLDSFRDRIAQARQERDERPRKTVLQKQVQKPLSVPDIKRAQTGLRILTNSLSRVLPKTVMDNITVRAKPFLKIDTTSPEVQRSLAQHGGTIKDIAGLTTINEFNALVQIAYNYDNDSIEATSLHEAFHVAAKWLLPVTEYNNLMRYFKGNEEDAADAFAGFAMGVKGKELNIHPNWIKSIFLKLRRYFMIVKNGLQGKGFARPEDVFAKLLMGEYKMRVPIGLRHERLNHDRYSRFAAARDLPVEPMYSQLVRAVKDRTDVPRKVPSLLKWLHKHAKPEEIKWLGAEDWINTHNTKGVIDRDAFIAFLEQSQITVNATERGQHPRNIDEILRLPGGDAVPDPLEWSSMEALELPPDEELFEGFEPGDIYDYEYETYAVDHASQDVYSIIGNNDVGYSLFRQPDGTDTKEHMGRFDELIDAKAYASQDLDERYTYPSTRYDEHTLEGGEEYRELLFTYPPRQIKNNFQVVPSPVVKGKYIVQDQTTGAVHPVTMDHDFFFDSLQESQSKALDLNLKYYLCNIEQEKGIYQSPHWDEENVLAHVRFKTRTDTAGHKVLFIEEIQSDWHQAGKKKGYADEVSSDKYKITVVPNTGQLGYPLDAKYWAMMNNVILGGGQTEIEAYNAGLRTLAQTDDERLTKPPPRTVFEKTWHEFLMKRMLRWAAENGFDAMAWTTGQMQIDRYDLRHEIDLITWGQVPGAQGSPAMELNPTVTIIAWKNGEQQLSRNVNIFTQLDDLVGKNIADQIRMGINRRETDGSIDAKDLVIGGKGMEVFYDEILPGFLRKYVKQWGASVGSSKITTGMNKSKSVYTGPTYTLDELKDIIKKIIATPSFPFMSTEVIALNQVRHAMNAGDSFHVAMSYYGNRRFADFLGGNLDITYEPVIEQVHSVALNDQMRKDVLFTGQTLFAKGKPSGGEAWALQYIQDALVDAAENPDDPKAQAKANRIRTEREWLRTQWPREIYQTTKDVIKAFKMGKKKDWAGMKPDTTFLERWLQSPEFYFEKVPAAWRVYEASLERSDDYNQHYNDMTQKDVLLAEIIKFKKADPKEYERLNKLMVRADQIKATHGPRSLRELGFSDQAIASFLAFRQMMDNGFDGLFAEMAKIIKEYEEAGLELPEVATWVGDKQVVVNLKMALALMGSMRGWYFPRQRKSGNWMLIAKKKGTNPILEMFETKTGANFRGNELKKQGYEITKTATKELPEDVFQLAGKTISLNAMINQALSKTIPEKMPTYEEFGLQAIMRTGPTGRKDFIVRGPTNKQTNSVMKSLGGRFWSSAPGEPKAWHFPDAPSDMSFRVLRALITVKGIPGAAESDLLFAHALATEVANVVKGRGFRSAMIGRRPETGEKVWVGYDTDLVQVASRYVTGISAGLAKKEVASRMVQAMTGTDVRLSQFESFEDWLDEVNRRRIDPGKQKNIFRDTTQYIQEMLRNEEFADRIIGTIKGIAVLKYLGFRLASPLVNLTALITSVPATMHGLGKIPLQKTFVYLTKALGAYHTYSFGDKESLPPDLVAMFDHIRLKGWDTAQYNLEALAVLRSKFSNKYRKLLEWSMFMFGATEKMNRVATIMGTYMALKDQGETDVEAMQALSKRVSDRSHGVYGKTTYPYIALGKNPAAQAAKCMYVFSKFSHTYLQNMYDLGFKRKDRQSLLYMMAAPAIISGAGSLPLLWPVIMQALRGLFDVDEPEERFYSWFDDHLGDFLGHFVRGGIAAAGGYGVSLKGSLSIDPVESFPTRLPEILGAPGNVLTDVWFGAESLMKGDIFRAAQKAGPRVTGSMMQAYNEQLHGVTTRKNTPKFLKGKKMEPENLDTLWRFLNFNPAHMAKIKEQKWSETRLIAKYRDLRSDLYSRIRAYYSKPQALRSRDQYLNLLADIDEYNKRVKLRDLAKIKGISYITKASIRTALKLKK